LYTNRFCDALPPRAGASAPADPLHAGARPRATQQLV